MIIHYCGYSSQPYIDVYCTGISHYVWAKGDIKIDDVYTADGNENSDDTVYYTFKWKNVTCKECLDKKEK